MYLQLLHSCTGKTSLESLSPFLSQSDEWLLIYGRGKQNMVFPQKHSFYCSPVMSNVISKNGFWRCI